MLIARPPQIFRSLFPDAHFRIRGEERCVYLTFDDGPIPEATPWVLDMLDSYGIKATFFMVGDNVRKYPDVYQEVIRRGHTVGNHTMHHLQGLKVKTPYYLDDIKEADGYIFRNAYTDNTKSDAPLLSLAENKFLIKNGEIIKL